MVVTVVATASPKQGRNRSSELSRGHSAPLFTLNPNMAKRTSAQLVWGSFWMAVQAERRGGDDHNGR
eukprot:1510103-Alexandrium_andersonii.AAC.1